SCSRTRRSSARRSTASWRACRASSGAGPCPTCGSPPRRSGPSRPTKLPGRMFARGDPIGVAVEDLDAAIALHEQTYGMAVAHREVVEEQGVEAVLLDGGENQVELLRPLDAE